MPSKSSARRCSRNRLEPLALVRSPIGSSAPGMAEGNALVEARSAGGVLRAAGGGGAPSDHLHHPSEVGRSSRSSRPRCSPRPPGQAPEELGQLVRAEVLLWPGRPGRSSGLREDRVTSLVAAALTHLRRVVEGDRTAPPAPRRPGASASTKRRLLSWAWLRQRRQRFASISWRGLAAMVGMAKRKERPGRLRGRTGRKGPLTNQSKLVALPPMSTPRTPVGGRFGVDKTGARPAHRPCRPCAPATQDAAAVDVVQPR